MTSMVSTSKDLSTWDTLQWRRKIETFGHDDEAVPTRGPAGETEAIWYICLVSLIWHARR
jgi:acid phosphatase